MSLSTIEYLRHILDELLFLSEQSHGLQKDEFINDAVLKRAFIRSLEVIGEATKQLPLTLRTKYSAVEWKIVAGMRDKLIHHYFGIDYDIVWDVIVSDVPEMRKVIEQMMVDLDKS